MKAFSRQKQISLVAATSKITRAVNERGIDTGRLPAGMSCVRERNVVPQILHRKHALYYNG